ncbi:MAG: hypothetical protein KC656_17160, partial [Myxococcales bacterium]|nr:hypothetical protein [Myxococcales bacterium]
MSTDLPPAYLEARAADEPFWRAQEARVQGATGQPCCTLSGISTGLIRMPGDFAVVIHGEDECASCFLHYGPSSHRFFCTGLGEEHFVTGETGERLDRCLRLVAEQVQPEALFVLGACPIEVIGDRFETVVEAVQADFPHIPMRAMHTSGLKVGSQTAMLDWMYSTLVGLPTRPPVDPTWREQVAAAGLDTVDAFLSLSPEALLERHRRALALVEPPPLERERCVSFLGLPNRDDLGGYAAEWEEVLREVGLVVTGDYPYAATLEDWRGATWPKAMFAVDRLNFPQTVQAIQEAGTQVVDVALPAGIAATDAFYRTLGETYGLQAEIEAAVAPRREAAVRAAEDFRRRRGGLRMAMGLRMLNNYKTDQLAQQGLGDHAALSELGFDITV